MNIILIFGLLNSFAIFFIGLLVLLSDRRKLVNKIFFILALFVSLWALFYVVSILLYDVDIIMKFIYVFGLFSSSVLFYFTLIYPKKERKYLSRVILFISVIVDFSFSLIALFTNLIVLDIKKSSNIAVPVLGELGAVFFLLVFINLLAGSFVVLYKYLKIYKDAVAEKRKLKYIVLGFSVTATLIVLMNLLVLLFGDNISWLVDVLTPFSLIFLISFTSYGILRGGLFDVRMAIVRSATYSLSLATMAGIYVGVMAILSGFLKLGSSTPAELAANVVVSLILVLVFQPLKRFFDKLTNKIFYRDNYNTDEFFARINEALAVTTDLRELLKKAAKEIMVTLKAEQAFFVVYLPNKRHVLVGVDNYTKLVELDVDRINDYFTKKPGVMATIALEETDEIRQVLSANKIGLVLPLSSKGNLIGFLCLGEKMSSNYVSRDLEALSVIANALVVAIQNALAVEEIQDFNITLRQRVDEATKELRVKNAMLRRLDKAKDDFIGMASHQLRTPLTSIKGYISMLVDGDAGKLNSRQKELLNDTYTSSDRMVRLVNDFLDVSRLQTGKFVIDRTTVNLMDLIKTEVDGLLMVAQKKEIKLSCACHDEVPPLEVDENKIRQVVMNFIDNAIFYSHPKSEIKIGLACDGEWVSFTVQDSGIGVPKAEQKELFTKFYRASNAKKQRPSGSGVGLYLAKKVIYAHDGKIIFETIEGKGSTFGFMLPVK